MSSAANVLRSLLAILQTRLELLGTEVREEIARLGLMLLWAYLALFFATLGAVLLTGAVILALWETHRIAAFITLGVLFLGLSAITAWTMLRLARQRPRLFEASLSELAQDRAELEARR